MQQMILLGTPNTAEFSPCGQYRYLLTRTWDEDKPPLVFLMLNPSTADAEKDDNTIRKCIKFSKTWGYGGLIVLNIFAYRSTDPKALYKLMLPHGPDNDSWIANVCEGKRVICAWGRHGNLHGRGNEVLALLERVGATVECLWINEDGTPKHPLYMPDSALPISYCAK